MVYWEYKKKKFLGLIGELEGKQRRVFILLILRMIWRLGMV